MIILDSEPNRFTPFLSMHKHIEAFVSIKVQDERYHKYVFPWDREPYLQESCTASKDLILQEHYSHPTREGTDLQYMLPDMVTKTLLINQCLYLHLKWGQNPNMASSSLFLICFFRNTSLLSFHVANADGYHSRVNTWGSWDSPQQLIAQTCWAGGTEPASSPEAFLPTAAVGLLRKFISNFSEYSRWPESDPRLATSACCSPFLRDTGGCTYGLRLGLENHTTLC